MTRRLLGILIFWGMAAASYRGDHITVDLIWSAMPPQAQHVLDVFSALVTLVGMTAFTWMFADKVIDIRAAHIGTFDLRQRVWPYYLAAWIGLAAAVLLLMVRTLRLAFAPGKLARSSATHTGGMRRTWVPTPSPLPAFYCSSA